ncbi:MAG: hypothetical protein JSS81_25195 [Acidobacteria bacterium]|nr:hypothetical protein [Acidobacteriota bacterium]
MKKPFVFVIFSIFLLLSVSAVAAQTSEFTYQGRLTDNSLPASGNYSMKFRLYDAVSGGTQIGAEVPVLVTITGGAFSVTLDFGANAFPAGGERWLEVQVGTTILAPRQKMTAAPLAVRALDANRADVADNALKLGGTPADQYVLTTDSRLTDARPPAAGSGNYIQNQNAAPQSADFNINGSGTIAGNLTVGGTISGNVSIPSLGQSTTTVYGTGRAFVCCNSNYVLLPGLTATVNVPANSIVLVSTFGGLSDYNFIYSTTYPPGAIVSLFLDDQTSPAMSQMANLPDLPKQELRVANWSMTAFYELPAGSHTFTLKATKSDQLYSYTYVSHDSSNPILQGRLMITILKK